MAIHSPDRPRPGVGQWLRIQHAARRVLRGKDHLRRHVLGLPWSSRGGSGWTGSGCGHRDLAAVLGPDRVDQSRIGWLAGRAWRCLRGNRENGQGRHARPRRPPHSSGAPVRGCIRAGAVRWIGHRNCSPAVPGRLGILTPEAGLSLMASTRDVQPRNSSAGIGLVAVATPTWRR